MGNNLRILLIVLYTLPLFINRLPGQTHFSFTETEDYYSIVLNSAMVDGNDLENGDEVGVFFRGQDDKLVCGGAVVWPKRALIAWEDDAQTSEKDGFEQGELLVFKIFKATAGMEHNTKSTSWLVGDGTFGFGSYAICNLEASGPADIAEHSAQIPAHPKLYQNYPNPFNPATTIRYSIPYDMHVVITIFDILGRKMEVIVDKSHPAGDYRFEYRPVQLNTGVYFYQLITAQYSEIKKMILLR